MRVFLRHAADHRMPGSRPAGLGARSSVVADLPACVCGKSAAGAVHSAPDPHGPFPDAGRTGEILPPNRTLARPQGGKAQGDDRKIRLLGRDALCGSPPPRHRRLDRIAHFRRVGAGLEKGTPRRCARHSHRLHDHVRHLLRRLRGPARAVRVTGDAAERDALRAPPKIHRTQTGKSAERVFGKDHGKITGACANRELRGGAFSDCAHRLPSLPLQTSTAAPVKGNQPEATVQCTPKSGNRKPTAPKKATKQRFFRRQKLFFKKGLQSDEKCDII